MIRMLLKVEICGTLNQPYVAGESLISLSLSVERSTFFSAFSCTAFLLATAGGAGPPWCLHLQILKDIVGVFTSVHAAILLKQLNQQTLDCLWWWRIIKFWNNLAALPVDNFHRQVALDDCLDAITRNVKNWAWSFMSGLRQIGYESTICLDILVPVEIDGVTQLLGAQALQVWDDTDICPRTCPSQEPCVHTADGLLGHIVALPRLALPATSECLVLACTTKIQDELSEFA